MQLVFFPDGKSVFGYASMMKMSLGNFKYEEITDEDFTLMNYIKLYKFLKIKLYLFTKSVDEIENIFESSDSEEELHPAFAEPGHSSSLVGSASERSSLQQQQDVGYLESLTKDREKENDKRKDLQRIQEKVKEEQDLYRARLAKVVYEPHVNEPHVTVSVRNLTLGVQTRRFPILCLISSVDEWIRSLSLYPIHFTLSSCDMASLDPSLTITLVDRALVNMAATDDSEEVTQFPALNKAGWIKQGNHDVSNTEVEEDILEVPTVLLEDDEM